MHFNAINFSLYPERRENVENYNFRFVMVRSPAEILFSQISQTEGQS